MNCLESLKLLSDYRDAVLDEMICQEIKKHLGDCPPCDGLFRDLDLIVRTSMQLREEYDVISFPDENAVWQHIVLRRQEV